MRIVLCYPVEPRHIAEIQAAAPGSVVIDAGQERIAEELPKADLFCGHAKVPVPWDDVMQAGRLQWIQSSAAGVDHCLVPSVRASSIPLTSASGVLADQVAEHTVALLGALLRSLPAFLQAQSRREYVRLPTRDLHRRRIGIIGLGGNGLRIAELLRPYRTAIVATDWFSMERPVAVDELLPADAIDEILPRVDVLILTAPLTPVTQNMIHANRLLQLPADAVLINVARGGLVVESDLAKVLADGHLAGAGLDVAAMEPLPKDSPLWELPNVLVTPHVGGQSARRADNMTNLFCENLRRWFAGSDLLNLVDKELGFPYPENRFRPE
ncbi:MAG: D-2-hydroxyacid dehydrogenase [Pirellulales bacterium]|nr:D-2-hydroxyacid dehydrogenase [Pirellulales bacterium]